MFLSGLALVSTGDENDALLVSGVMTNGTDTVELLESVMGGTFSVAVSAK